MKLTATITIVPHGYQLDLNDGIEVRSICSDFADDYDEGAICKAATAVIIEAMRNLERKELSCDSPGWETLVTSRNTDGEITGFEAKYNSRRLRWSYRTGTIEQLYDMPVANHNGYGDGYWRKACRNVAGDMRTVMTKYARKHKFAAMLVRP